MQSGGIVLVTHVGGMLVVMVRKRTVRTVNQDREVGKGGDAVWRRSRKRQEMLVLYPGDARLDIRRYLVPGLGALVR